MYQIVYRLSEKAREERFIATGSWVSEKQLMNVNPVELTPAERGLLLEWSAIDQGPHLGTWVVQDSYGTLEVDRTRFDAELTVADALHEVRRMVAEYPAAKAESDRRKAECAAANAARQEKREREKEAERIAAEAFRAERAAWAAVHGSEHLRRAVGASYSCTSLYLRERGAVEYPGFVVDLGNMATWKSRSCPSVTALDLVDAVLAQHGDNIIAAEVVWLTSPPRASTMPDDDYGRQEYWECCEAVIVKDRRYRDNVLVRETQSGPEE